MHVCPLVTGHTDERNFQDGTAEKGTHTGRESSSLSLMKAPSSGVGPAHKATPVDQPAPVSEQSYLMSFMTWEKSLLWSSIEAAVYFALIYSNMTGATLGLVII